MNLSPSDAVEERTAMNLTFSRDDSDDPFTAIVPIPTVDDPAFAEGSFEITIQDDSSSDQQFTLSSDPTELANTTVLVEDLPIPELVLSESVYVLEGNVATLMVTTTTNPKRDLNSFLYPSRKWL